MCKYQPETEAVSGTHMSSMSVVAGVDIGGTNTRVGILDPSGGFHGPEVFPTQSCDSVETYVTTLASVITRAVRLVHPEARLVGVGVAAPAGNTFDGTIQSPANLTWGTVNIRSVLEACVGVPVTVANDAGAAALGEYWFGAGRGTHHCVVVTLGTGLGAGFILDGKLLRGAHGLAGELGHVILEPEGRVCGCGRRGCAETYASASGLRRTMEELLATRSGPSVLRAGDPSARSAWAIFKAADQGDVLAREAFAITGRYLGRLLVDLAAVFDPDMIILSGGLMNAGKWVLTPAVDWFHKHVLPVRLGTVQIVQSQMANGEAAMRGAASLAARAANLPGHGVDDTRSPSENGTGSRVRSAASPTASVY
jgi:glucokinase